MHVVDMHTIYHTGPFIGGTSSGEPWKLFVSISDTLYGGFPDVLCVEREPSFLAAPFPETTEAVGVVIQASGVQDHNEIGVSELDYVSLKQVYSDTRLDDRLISTDLALRQALKALNDTIGPDGLVHTLLVFRPLPCFPGHGSKPTGRHGRASLRPPLRTRCRLRAKLAEIEFSAARGRLP